MKSSQIFECQNIWIGLQIQDFRIRRLKKDKEPTFRPSEYFIGKNASSSSHDTVEQSAQIYTVVEDFNIPTRNVSTIDTTSEQFVKDAASTSTIQKSLDENNTETIQKTLPNSHQRKIPKLVYSKIMTANIHSEKTFLVGRDHPEYIKKLIEGAYRTIPDNSSYEELLERLSNITSKKLNSSNKKLKNFSMFPEVKSVKTIFKNSLSELYLLSMCQKFKIEKNLTGESRFYLVECITPSEKSFELLKHELQIFKSMHHPNICSLLDFFVTPEYIFNVYEDRSLRGFLAVINSDKFQPINAINKRMYYSAQFLLALEYMHKCGVIDKNLKLDRSFGIDHRGYLKVIIPVNFYNSLEITGNLKEKESDGKFN
jgi:hypothetical protein